MKLWVALYLMIWLSVIEIVVVLSSLFSIVYPVIIHILLGFVIFGLASNNLRLVRKTDAPDRIKRILNATLGFAAFQGFLGILIFVDMNIFSIPFMGIADFLHLIISLTILAQASSAATGYDMWEEKEIT